MEQEQESEIFSWKTEFPTKFAELSNGETLGYREAGESDIPLILIHGHQSSSLTFERIIKYLSPHIWCVAVCLRGFGYSTYHTPINGMKDLAADVRLFITEHLEAKEVFVLGHSLGGGVAQALAI